MAEARRPTVPRPRAGLLRRLGRRGLLAFAVIGAGIAYVLAGRGGLLVWLSAVAATACGLALLGVPAAVPPRRRARPPVPVENAPFRSYRQTAEALSWARASPRHFDVATRPVLMKLMVSRLTDRRGIDVHRSPDAARALLGDEVWVWLDPRRPPSSVSDPPGPDAAALTRIVERLESL